LKIVYISTAIIPSRTANSIQVMKMCQAFAKNGHNIILLVPNRQMEIEPGIDDVFDFYCVDKCFKIKKLSYLDTRSGRILYVLFKVLYSRFLMREIKYLQPDIVYGRDVTGCYIAALLGYRCIFELHIPVWYGSLGGAFAFNRLLRCKNLEKIVVITETLKGEYLKSYPSKLNKIIVAPDGSDRVTDLERIRHWSGRKGVLQVGYIGHLYHGKGMEVIAELAPQMPEVDFHIIGGMEKDITYWKKKVKLHNIFFHGFVPQNRISKYINSLDACLLPNQKQVLPYGAKNKPSSNISNYTSPLKLFDYMAHKKAIIASDLPVLREILNEKNAIIVKHDDIKAWKAAIERLKNDSLRGKLGDDAYKDFCSNFTWEIRAKKVIS